MAAKAVDAVGYLCARAKALPRDCIMNILVIRLDDIGDLVLATPVVRNLKEAFPAARIDMLVKSSTSIIVRNNPCINRVWELDPFWMRSPKPYGFNRYVALIRQLRRERYDLTLELRGNPFNILLAFFIGGGHRVGYGAQGLGFLLNSVVPYEDNPKHEIERNLDVLRALRTPIRSQMPEFFISEAAVSGAEVFLREHEVHEEDLLIAIHPGASWPPKCWPIENYAALAAELIDRYRAKIILIGATKESGLCIRLRDIMRSEERQHVVIAAGATTLQETAALIKSSKLFIGSDSGPLHIAHAVNTSAVALFGPQNPVMCGPHQNSAVAIYRKADCSPCVQKVSQCCHRGFTCCEGLLSITPQDVLEAVEAFTPDGDGAPTKNHNKRMLSFALAYSKSRLQT